MIRLMRWLAAVLLAVSAVLLAGAPAHADEDTPSSWKISRYDVDVTLVQPGYAKVVVDLDFDFGSDRGHGPYIVMVARMPDNSNPDRWRMFDIELDSVRSSTGANTVVKEMREGSAVVYRIGTEGQTFAGVQNYRIEYTATGLIDPKNPTSGLDEFNWSAIGTGWEVPINNISVTVNSVADTQRVGCFTGSNFQTSCDQATGFAPASAGGDSVTWTADRLAPGQGMQVVAGYAAGTFTDPVITYTKRYRIQNMFPATPTTIGGGLAAAAGGVAAVAALARRKGRDRAYLGLIPGLSPVAGAEVSETTATRAPVTVQFQPPKQARPGEIGVLVDETADNRDVTATIIDLAVRGHLHIVPHGEDFTLIKTHSTDELARYEATLLSQIFLDATHVTQQMMATKERASVLTSTRTALYQQVTHDRGWFRSNPSHTRTAWVMLGLAAVIVAGLATVPLSTMGLGLIGLGLVLPGVAILAVSQSMPARTAEGSAMLAQAKGFELYLRTAEADQIKFEEGIDVFSRYLPYAIIFGVADRWAAIFQDLAARGIYQGDTRWFGGNPGIWMAPHVNFGGMVDSMTSSMTSSMNQAVAASHASRAGSGGSGFSGGGGGFGGGGGGGW